MLLPLAGAPVRRERVEWESRPRHDVNLLELRTAWKRVVNRMPNDEVSAETRTAAGFERVSGVVWPERPRGRVEAPAESRVSEAELGHVSKISVPFLAWRGI